MNIRDIRKIKAIAAQRLDTAQYEKQIVLIFGGISTLTALLVTVVNYCLGLEIDKTGGLSNFGLRSVLASIQNFLPLVQMGVLMCLELGYMAAMLRIGRGQYTSAQTLRAGMPRFWAMLRAMLLQTLMYLGVGLASFYLGMQLYLFTPMANGFLEAMTPLLTAGSEQEMLTMMASDAALQETLLGALVPMYVLALVFFAAGAVPIAYQYRMVNYVLLDKPAVGALAAMRESKRMMRRNRFSLFRLDLSFWWYYAISVLGLLVCYGDVWLALLGVQLPLPGTVSYFLFYGLYLVISMASCYFLRNRVEVAYVQAYEAVRPREQQGGVVLGNIFHTEYH